MIIKMAGQTADVRNQLLDGFQEDKKRMLLLIEEMKELEAVSMTNPVEYENVMLGLQTSIEEIDKKVVECTADLLSFYSVYKV
jgi:hypothetical protein